jgi:outer membrane murein-binding lipoprotein Lpp
MKTCQYYKGTEQVGADSTRILCSYMASGGKVFKNNDPESAALIQCCWHAEKAEKECPLWSVETADTILDKPDAVPNDEDEDADGIEFNEGEKLQMLADGFRKMSKTCPYYSSELGKVEVNSFGAMEFECEHTKMIFAEESKAGEWLERCCLAPEKCYHYRKAKEEKGQPVEQQTFTTEIAEKADTSISTERQDRAAQLTQRIMANGKIAASSMIEMGRDLKTVRDERLFTEMGYENFEEYCEKKIGIGKRHGYNFIQIYEKFGEEKLGQLQQLGITKLLEIAKLDDEDADDLMQNNDVNALSVRELSAKVDEYRNKFEQLTLQLEEEKSKNAESDSLESQVEELRKQLEAARQANENMKSGAHNAEKHFEEQKAALLKEKEALSEQIRELESRPTEKTEISEEERNALIQQGRDEMCKEKDEDWSNVVELARKTATRNTEKKFTEEISSLKILNDELRKVADGAKESTKKYKDELEKLKAENTALQSNAQVVEAPAPAPTSGARDKVKFYFKQIETAFAAATEAVSEADTEERAELTSALKKALERMGAILEQT